MVFSTVLLVLRFRIVQLYLQLGNFLCGAREVLAPLPNLCLELINLLTQLLLFLC